MKSAPILPVTPEFWKNRVRAEAAIDRALMREGLLSNKTVESIGRKFDYASTLPAPKEAFQFPHDSVFLDSPERRASFLFRAATDLEFAAIVNRDRAICMSSPLGGLMGPAPANFRDSVLRRLIENRVFSAENPDESKEHDPKLETAAFLTERGLNTRGLFYQYAPAFDFDEFHRYQSKINRMIDRSLPEAHHRFEAFLQDKKLKHPIRHALKVALLENEENESWLQIAKRVRIPYETLRSRVKTGTRILKRHFPDLIPLDEQPRTPKPRFRERQFGGFLLRSECRRVQPVFRADPKSDEKTPDLSRQAVTYKDLKKTPQKGLRKKMELYRAAEYFSPYDALWGTQEVAKPGGTAEYKTAISSVQIGHDKRLDPVRRGPVAPKV